MGLVVSEGLLYPVVDLVSDFSEVVDLFVWCGWLGSGVWEVLMEVVFAVGKVGAFFTGTVAHGDDIVKGDVLQFGYAVCLRVGYVDTDFLEDLDCERVYRSRVCASAVGFVVVWEEVVEQCGGDLGSG